MGGVKVPQNIFEIYDGRTSFWQWDTGQKLIVLDESITQVHFSNKNMNYTISKDVYEYEEKRVCDIPDIVLQSPNNLVAYAYICDAKSGYTIKSVKFAVIKRPAPYSQIDIDGGNGNGFDDEDILRVWDGGSASGY